MATLEKRPDSMVVIQESRFLHGRCSQTDPIVMGAEAKRPTGTTPATSSCNCRLAGPVPLRLSALRAMELPLSQNED
jgi:hypothetical protein